MTIRETLNLFPLQTVLYPETLLPLRIFEPRYVDLVGTCMREQTNFGIVGIESGNEVGVPPDVYSVGTEARIVDFGQGADGMLNIVVQGGRRFEIQSTEVGSHQLLMAAVVWLDPVPSRPLPAAQSYVADLLRALAQDAGVEAPDGLDSTPRAIYELAMRLPLDPGTKTGFLACGDADELASQMHEALEILRNAQS